MSSVHWKISLVVIVILMAIAGVIYSVFTPNTTAPAVEGKKAATIRAVFTCDAGKSANATFDNNANTVFLVLSDGRTMTVPHAISADGARYANADESFVFWNVGDTAFITENGTTTFANCTTANTVTGKI